MKTSPPICANCFYCKIKNYLFFKRYICKLNTLSTTNKITGKTKLNRVSCKTQRSGETNVGFCGPLGSKFITKSNFNLERN